VRLLVFCTLAAAGCNHAIPSSTDASIDAATLRDASAATDQLIADLVAPFDAGPCILSNTFVEGGGGPIQVGTLCNYLEVCAPDEASAALVTAAAPGFICEASQINGCPFHCIWDWLAVGGHLFVSDPDEAAICAVTELPFGPMIYCEYAL
jgi:hypothetical protein